MIDHTGVTVRDCARSKAFYAKALAPIGYTLLVELTKDEVGANVAGFGEGGRADFWINEGTPNRPHIHVAFRATTRAVVDAFHRAALEAGGTDNGPPGLRPHYHAGYYGAFVTDPDGHNIEVVCREEA